MKFYKPLSFSLSLSLFSMYRKRERFTVVNLSIHCESFYTLCFLYIEREREIYSYTSRFTVVSTPTSAPPCMHTHTALCTCTCTYTHTYIFTALYKLKYRWENRYKISLHRLIFTIHPLKITTFFLFITLLHFLKGTFALQYLDTFLEIYLLLWGKSPSAWVYCTF